MKALLQKAYPKKHIHVNVANVNLLNNLGIPVKADTKGIIIYCDGRIEGFPFRICTSFGEDPNDVMITEHQLLKLISREYTFLHNLKQL